MFINVDIFMYSKTIYFCFRNRMKTSCFYKNEVNASINHIDSLWLYSISLFFFLYAHI